MSYTKPDYYKKTEAALYEYYTLDTAITILERRATKKVVDDKMSAEKATTLLEDKLQLKQDIETILLRLSKADQDFIQNVYGNPEATPSQLCNQFTCSTAKYYRDKRSIVKKVALLLGYI